ncbi:MAG: UDP-3-0-acyl N-acetylglucosamine deacetylase [Planctomycetaceae bacterium]|nr:UDP-3-0-acyl N-acetylglucosamine deacetylase [Planctomycetaceae bacterium]
MQSRFQQTLARPASVTGIGFLTGADITVRFFPAPADHGVTFTRTDVIEHVAIPALVEFTAQRSRRTALEHRGVSIELIEHVMAALAGLQIDNCRVELNGPELPGCDGSSRMFADCLLDAGLLTLDTPRDVCSVHLPLDLDLTESSMAMSARPNSQSGLRISYELDYGTESPIPAQSLTIEVTPDTFLNEIVFARTFVLEAEARAFLAQGMGQRLSFQDLLVYGSQGVIDNELRAPDECVRHKILDCIGDLALLGCDLSAHVICRRTGHRQNADLVRSIQQQRCQEARGFRDAA